MMAAEKKIGDHLPRRSSSRKHEAIRCEGDLSFSRRVGVDFLCQRKKNKKRGLDDVSLLTVAEPNLVFREA